jgi:hypothetical protein
VELISAKDLNTCICILKSDENDIHVAMLNSFFWGHYDLNMPSQCEHLAKNCKSFLSHLLQEYSEFKPPSNENACIVHSSNEELKYYACMV